MGMITRMDGSIHIEPALNHVQIRQFEATKPVWTRLVIDEQEVDTPDGVLHKRTADELEIISFDSKNYNVSGELQTLVDLFPGHDFSGMIDCVYEDISFEATKIDGIYRLAVRNGKVERVEPTVSWPSWIHA